jgi:hypothetical protein
MVNVYDHFILNSDIDSGCYNAGFENITILDIAKKISSVNDCEIIVTESNDPRSYRQDSQKLINTGFNPSFGVFDAITQISESLSNGKLIDNENWYTIKTMKKIKF